MAASDFLQVTQPMATAALAPSACHRSGFLRWLSPRGQKAASAAPLCGQIEAPAAGTAFNHHEISLRGWVCGSGPAVDAIEVRSQGQVVATLQAAIPRPDVSHPLPGRAAVPPRGFAGTISLLGCPASVHLQLLAVGKDRASQPFGSIRLRRQPLAGTYRPQLQPLLIHAQGRSGTTWLMRLLSEHPEVAVGGSYPFEVLAGQAWLGLAVAMIRQMHQGLNDGLLAYPTWLYADPRVAAQIGTPAGRLDLGPDALPGVIRQALAQVDAYYLEQAQARGGKTPVVFAEKVMYGPGVNLLQEVCAVNRQVILVRDFRDVFCSIRAFNAKRKYQAFGRQKVDSDSAHVDRLCQTARRLVVLAKQARERACLVRYEDLILQPTATLSRLLGRLELAADPELLAAVQQRARQDTPEMQNHRTSSSPERSIGRWQDQLEPALQKQFVDRIGDVLQELDYPLEPKRRAAA